MSKILLVQIALIDPAFDPRTWLHEVYTRGEIITGGFMPPLGNIQTFYVSMEHEEGDFELQGTDFAASLDLLMQNLTIGGYVAMSCANARGETFATWSNDETISSDTESENDVQ